MIKPIGHIKLWREMALKPIWLNSTPEQKTILITLLMSAHFSPSEWEWKGEKYKVQRGQFITSIDTIIKDSGKGITPQNVRTALKRFEKLGFLTNESTKTGRLITILNWDLYQSKEKNQQTDEQTPNKELTNDQQSPNKELTPKEECYKEKNVEEGSKEDFKEDIYTPEKEIFDFWNSKDGVIKSQEKSFDKSKISTAIKKYGSEEIMTAIKRLSDAVTDKGYYYSFSWNIYKFLKQGNGISNWLDDGQLWNDYKNNSKKGEKNNCEQTGKSGYDETYGEIL